MAQKAVTRLCLAAAAVLILVPLAAYAQGGSGIAGVVKDTTGAVTPGVTVEAASPALIEKVRSVVTDANGVYKIIDLRPGVYSVTFTLAGFTTARREGIELTANFTADVNAELRVGSIEETITVSGASPVVDVQNVIQQVVLNSEVLAALPTARSQGPLVALVPGIQLGSTGAHGASGIQDVGGSAGEDMQTVSIHGSKNTDMSLMIDGIPQNNATGFGVWGIYMDPGATQEFTFELGALSAESAVGGVRYNAITRSGGNRFTGTVFGTFTNNRLQNDNFSADLKARGLTALGQVKNIYDFNPSFGGPIMVDKLWFYMAARYWGASSWVAGMYYNKTQNSIPPLYTPDLSRQAIDDSLLTSGTVRLTWQPTPKNKFSAFWIAQGRRWFHQGVSATVAPEAVNDRLNAPDYGLYGTWSAPLTNRVLLEAGGRFSRVDFPTYNQSGVSEDTLSIQELSTGLLYHNALNYGSAGHTWIWDYKAALSYVTGSHAVKVGFNLEQGKRRVPRWVDGDLNLQFLNGLPRSFTVNATPFTYEADLNGWLGMYAQDQWTVKRLTLNTGIRFDYLNASDPEQHLPAVRFLGARDFAPVPNVPNWRDISPRFGASYDLFGTGKTAVKVTLSRYLQSQLMEFATSNNPVNTSVNSAARSWTDINGNYYPDCDLLNPAANAECGPLSDANFGKVLTSTRYDDALRDGFGVRGYNWETTAGVQHELLPRVSANVTYFRRWFGNFTLTDNVAVKPADYDPYCITAPVNAALPGGGNNLLCGLYDINPSKFGQVNNLVTFAKKYGDQWEHFNGVDATINARLPRGAFLQGGLSMGRIETNNCFVVNSPQQLRFCDVKPPFLAQLKLLGSYPLPWWGLQASGTFQSLPGPQILATYPATSTLIRPSLGRNLASGPNGTAAIELIQPGTTYGDRLYQLDGRLAKIIKVGRIRVQANLDIYNAANASTVLVQNNIYGPAWQRPQYVLPGRLFKFSAQVDF